MKTPIPWEKSYAAHYILSVPAENIVESLKGHFQHIQSAFEHIPEKKSDFHYAEGKWTVRQVMGHVVDSQIIFAYRALCFSRGETQPLPGFEEKDYAVHWSRRDIPLTDVARNYRLQSHSTLAQAESLNAQELNAPGVANNIGLSALQVYRALIGHERHHLQVLRENYGIVPAAKN